MTQRRPHHRHVASTLAVTAVVGIALAFWPASGDAPDNFAEQAAAVPVRTGPTITARGMVFDAAPAVAVPDATAVVDVSLDDLRAHMQANDVDAALRAAEAYVEQHRWGRSRDTAWLLIGLLHREAGRPNLASEAFTKVRVTKSHLAPMAAYYEAEQDFTRGKPYVAIRECERYQETWPKEAHAGDCLRLQARAWARVGNAPKALAAASAYDEDHPLGPITEQIELAIATWQVEHQPEAAVHRLRGLAMNHAAPLTGRIADEKLHALKEAGIEGAELGDSTDVLKARAVSLRDSGNRFEALMILEELGRRAPDDPNLARWIEAETTGFGWRARDWNRLAAYYQAKYDKSPNGDDLWSLHRTLSRAGRWKEATEVAEKGLKEHGRTRHWYRNEHVVARAFMLAGDYPRARQLMDARAARGGWTGRRAAYFAAFNAYMAGELDDAVERFSRIVDRDRGWVPGARYWRARALEKLERGEEAEADDTWLVTEMPQDWYGVLARQRRSQSVPNRQPFARSGRWPGEALPPAALPPAITKANTPAMAGWVAPGEVSATNAFSRMAWPMQATTPVWDPVEDPAPTGLASLSLPPSSYSTSVFFDEDKALNDLRRLGDTHAETWPELRVIYDLASVGLYDLSGPLMAEAHEDWKKQTRRRGKRADAARAMSLRTEEWRALFLVTRDHHHTSRYLYGMHEDITEPTLAVEAKRLGWPLAHDRYVWTHAREHNMDPFLVLGLMRQESNYSPIATSRVGARGAMQIMPRTGHLLADLQHDREFTAGDLEDPVLSVGYGITYLGLLMDRFDGVYPLAIASYNGGPHNVSSWIQGTGSDVPVDVFVEHIPFSETRDYVKKVSAGYATYLDIYAPEGTMIVLPPHLRGDHATVVDF